MTKREPGLDLLRCLALLGVVSYHFFLYNGYYHEAQTGLWMWLAGSARTLSIGCIGVFLMLTGYLGCTATGWKVCWKALPPVLLSYLLAAVVSIPVRHFALRETATLQNWISRLFSFSAVYYGWYVEMFVGLTLLRPFLNRLLQILDTRGLLSLCAVLLMVTALPGATPLPLAPDYWYKLYPVTYYVLGAAVRRLQPRISVWVGLGTALAVAVFLSAATVLSTAGPLDTAYSPQFGDLWIVLLVMSVFLSIYRSSLPAPHAKLAAFFAGGSYGAYLLSHLLDAWCYNLLPQWKHPQWYWLLYLCIAIPIWLISSLAGRLLQGTVTRLLRKTEHWACRTK